MRHVISWLRYWYRLCDAEGSSVYDPEYHDARL